MPEFSDLYIRAALTLGLGLIIGFQRERKESTIAGIRTFPIIALTGFFCAVLEKLGVNWSVAAGLVALSVILFRTVNPSQGITTEVTAFFIYLLGAFLVYGENIELAVVAGGTCALLLHLKETMHSWVGHLNDKEVKAIMQFILIACVIYPLLPDVSYDKFRVLNPREIWLMVVLITGISVGSFSAQRILGPRLGSLWSGIFGGLVSSTATTFSMARLSSKVTDQNILVPAIIISSTAAFIRILLEVGLVAPEDFTAIVMPIGILFLFMAIQSAITYFRASQQMAHTDLSEKQNPSQIKPALVFGALYAVILYSSAYARVTYGEKSIYLVSFFSGLIDVDAIVISTSRLLQTNALDITTGWKSILLAFISNLAFKTCMVAFFAEKRLKKLIGLHFGLSILVGMLIFFFWS